MLKLQGVWSTFILFTKPKWLVKWCTHMQVLKIISMKLTVIYSSLNYAESTYGMKPSHCMFSNIWELCITHSSIIGQYSVFTYVHCNWHEIGVDFVQAVTSFIIRLMLGLWSTMGSIQLNQTAWLHVVVVALFTMCFVGPSDTVDTALSLFQGKTMYL